MGRENQLCGRPLTFGDKEQIDELQKMAEMSGVKTKKFTVTFSLSGEIELEVEAFDKDDAVQKAKDEFDDLRPAQIMDYIETDDISAREG